jgi:hypothetical protein
MLSKKENVFFRAYRKSNKYCKNKFTGIDEIKDDAYVFNSGKNEEELKSLKNAPRTLHQTEKLCFDSSSSTELMEEKINNQFVTTILVLPPCSAQRLFSLSGSVFKLFTNISPESST